ncbi:hypothetical protein HBH82_109810 [Parastagonospora nodorum]|nr:hypothetical protein HBH82_109810 [Parastagonospora nodorum]KAH4665851.1 hypothetical protein HBH78_201360 [Parastagonospora nodorum]KAH4697216.1 hypothetical protein HBH67_182890 [Parastagonospora nodorum]KAH4765527.1 hypothetical protein HBH63_179750 [Parastagonospora nodorum]KAH4792252.1 hypothetical protein HBH62_028340 [Parastagonospora nodorum]
MLARASSDAGTRLRRSKSTSTVHRHPPPILELLDPDLARQQAVAAATAAFVRAHTQGAADRTSKRSSEVSRSKSNASRKSITMQGQGSHFPPRDSSFRSMHPQKTGQDATSQRPSRASTINTETFPPFHPMPSMDRPVSAPRPLSAQPSIAFSEHARPNTQPKAGRLSVSSSVTSQQIRKARSMYYASSVQTGSPIARPPTMYLTTPPPVTATSTLEIPVQAASARALAPSPLAMPRIPVTVETNETVDKARDKYLQSFQQRSVRHKPSLFMAPFMKRQGKGKSKRTSSSFASVSATSHRTPEDYTPDFTLTDFMPQVEAKDKRSFSGSLKSKLKRVFRRSSKPASDLPVQQIQASRDYFGTAPIDIHDSEDIYDIPSPDEDVLQRVRARTPSYAPSRPAYTRSGSRSSSNVSARSKRSNPSLHSETNVTNVSVSRVTSWGTTSTQDTLAQRAIKRLTIIHESKDSIGSEADQAASLLTKRKSLPSSTLAAFRDPMPMESLLEETSTPIDPKRVFSALMREIEISKSTEDAPQPPAHTPGAESDVFESSKTKVLHSADRDLHSSASRDFRMEVGNEQRPPSRRGPSAAAQSTQGKASSIRTLGRAIRSTIRTVTPGEQRSSPCPVQHTSVRGTMRIPRDELDPSAVATSSDVEEDCINIDTSQPKHTREMFSPSREQIERRVSKAKERWKTPLDDVAQLQFPREMERTYNVAEFTQRTVQEDDQRESLEEEVEVHRTDISGPSGTPCSPTQRTMMSPLSPSVYSRNTDGMSILPNDSVMSFSGQDGLERHHNGGSAVILTSKSVRSYVVGTPSPRRPDSARSSRDWKAWLSHEVSNMEFTSQEDLRINEQYLTPSSKYRRYNTRTSHYEQDDTTVILRPSCDTITPHIEPITLSVLAAETVERHTLPLSVEQLATTPVGTSVLERSQSHTDTSKEVTPDNSPPNVEPMQGKRLKRPESTPLFSRQRPALTPSHTSSTSQPLVETPRSALMNDRFPFIDTGRRSSSNSARSSRNSRSPPDSVASSFKSTKGSTGPKIYSDLSAPPTHQTSQRSRNSALMSSEGRHASKENLTPPSIIGVKGNGRPSISPLGPSTRARSLQPLSSVALNRSTTNIGQYTSNIPEIKHSKYISSPAASPPRPRIRAILREASPEKLSRRPKSALDLRGAKTSLPRPSTELRRPALHLKPSTSSFTESREPSPGTEGRAIDSILEEGERSGSITPGQRMADRFLRERKSMGLLEGKKLRGGMRLVREDTPAFL